MSLNILKKITGITYNGDDFPIDSPPPPTDTAITITENGVINTPDNIRYNPITVNTSSVTKMLATSVSASTLTFQGTSAYNNFIILYVADTGYAAASQVYGIYSYAHYDNYYRAVYYMSYGGAKFNFTKNSSPDEIKRSGDNFTISSTYTGIGLGYITNTNQGKYYGLFW